MKIRVRVTPRSSKERVEKIGESEYKVYVATPPADGAANKRLTELLSKHFRVAKSCIRIVNGASSRVKTIEIL